MCNFSIARFPRLRSDTHPWGFDTSCPITAVGNQLLRFALACLQICGLHGIAASHEHPASAFSWHVACWDSLLRHPRAEVLLFSMCMYRENFRKNTKLFTINAEFLRGLRRPCSSSPGGDATLRHSHRPLTGSATTAAAKCPADLVCSLGCPGGSVDP